PLRDLNARRISRRGAKAQRKAADKFYSAALSLAYTVRPPSTGKQAPVTKSLSMKCSTACTTFSGFPSRLARVALIDNSRSDGDKSGGIITGPGMTQLTRTRGLRVPSSTANIRVSVGMAPFDGK